MRRLLEHLGLSLIFLRSRKLVRSLVSKELRRAARLGVFPSVEVEDLLPDADIGLVLDVGANRGQFALLAAAKYPNAKIVSFEPGAKARAVLEEVLAGSPAETDIRPFGLGFEAGSRTLFVTESDDSSSLLTPSTLQEEAHPESGVISAEIIELRRGIDEINLEDVSGAVLLKLDIQGPELDALRGMGASLESVHYVLIELSISEMYVGQSLAAEVVSFLHGSGFEFEYISPVQSYGRTQTQFDALFRRSELLEVGTPAEVDLVCCKQSKIDTGLGGTPKANT